MNDQMNNAPAMIARMIFSQSNPLASDLDTALQDPDIMRPKKTALVMKSPVKNPVPINDDTLNHKASGFNCPLQDIF